MAKQQKGQQDTFQWIGVSSRGKKLEGEMNGSSMALVKAQLRKQGITPSKVKKKPKPLFGGGPKRITPQDIAMVTRQIATMLLAGVSLVQAVDMIADGSEHSGMKALLTSIGEEGSFSIVLLLLHLVLCVNVGIIVMMMMMMLRFGSCYCCNQGQVFLGPRTMFLMHKRSFKQFTPATLTKVPKPKALLRTP